MAKVEKATRRYVTPEHLNVAPEVLGLPLGAPRKRALAMAVDLGLIVTVSSLASGWLLLAVACVPLMQAWFDRRRQPVPRWAWAGVAMLCVLGLQQFWVEHWGSSPEAVTARAQRAAEHAHDNEHEDDGAESEQAVKVAVAQSMAHTLASAAAQGASAPLRSHVREFARGVASEVQAVEVAADAAAKAASSVSPALRIAQLESELAQARKPSPFRWWRQFKKWLNDAGLSYGWAIVYFSVLPAYWRGQTLGKRLFGLRVVELTNKPMTMVHCLKRYGGYAAGMATGGLGFLQILWDPNRQALHDKAAHTVVVNARGVRALATPPAVAV